MTAGAVRPRWVWPWRPPRRVAEAAWTVAGAADGGVTGRRWLPVAVAVGTLPVLLGFAVGTSSHQLATAVCTGFLVLACVRRDDLFRAVGVVAVVFATHSAAVIALTVHDPERAALILPGADAYWQRIRQWVTAGIDDEYRWTQWVPEHLLLLFGVPLLGYMSLGVLPYLYGFEQLDLMNYYVGRLIPLSESPGRAVLFGWHPWSVLRGLAYTVLTFEAASWSLERLTGRGLSTRRRRAWRWAAGVGLAVADAVTKFCLSPVVQQQLHDNLLPDAL